LVNPDKHIAYWRSGSTEGWAVGAKLVKEGALRHGLFFLRLVLEKVLKAHVCRTTRDLAPRTHDLVGLAELTDLKLSSEQMSVLEGMSDFNIEGRYPETLKLPPSQTEALKQLVSAEEIFQWLIHQF
jgi:HEPN domain-containing protein